MEALPVFSLENRTNWVKAWLALDIAQNGLRNFIDKEIQNLQTCILQKVRSKLKLQTSIACQRCYTENLLTCPTPGFCTKVGGVCKVHTSKMRRPCPFKMCDEIRDEIIKEHRYGRPSWKNTAAQCWTTNHWHIAKCFLPPDGYNDVHLCKDTDFNGVISVMQNCKHFDTQMSQTGASVLTKARDIGRFLRHLPSCAITDSDLQDVFKTLTTLLSDPTALINDSFATAALRKLNELENDSISPEELYQLINDAQETVDLTKSIAEESKKEMEQYKERCFRELDLRMQMCMDNILDARYEKEEIKYVRDVEELLQRLKSYYNDNLFHVPVSVLTPDKDTKIRNVYTTPKIHEAYKGKNGLRRNCIYKYRHFLDCSSHRRIFLQGEAGTGKSTFCAKLVLDWSDPIEGLKRIPFRDIDTLAKFKFIFYIKLREANTKCELEDIIKDQILDNLYKDSFHAFILLQQILNREKCILLQDGLDEWTSSNDKFALPRLATYGSQCVMMTTTRPWKMADERIKNSQIDYLLELEGIANPYQLSKNILECLTGKNMHAQYKEFKDYIHTCNLEQLLSSPMFITSLVCSWVDGVHVTGSLCEIYSILLDCLVKKVNTTPKYFERPQFQCFKNTAYLASNIDDIDNLSKTAFHLLFCSENESSNVFSDKELTKYITDETKMFSLKAGILSERKGSSLTNRLSHCSFIHRSIQEFLAACYIASNADLNYDIVAKYMEKNAHAYLEMSNVFICLCGLNIEAAYKMSCLMDEFTRTPYPITLQRIIISGYKEAIANMSKGSKMRLKLGHFYFDDVSKTDDEVLEFIFGMNASNVRSVSIFCTTTYNMLNHVDSILSSSTCCLIRLEMCITGTAIANHGVDLSPCHSLETVDISGNVNLFPKSFLQLKNLKYLKLWCNSEELDLSSCSSLETIIIGGDITLLPTTFHELKSLKRIQFNGKCAYLAMTLCRSLETVVLKGTVKLLLDASSSFENLISVTLDCICDRLDLSSCINLETVFIRGNVALAPNALQGAKNLKFLSVECSSELLDLSQCHKLETIYIKGNVTFTPNSINEMWMLKKLSLLCKCEGLKISSCPNLRTVTFGRSVALCPDAVCELTKLKHFSVFSDCTGLDLTACQNVEKVYIGGEVKCSFNNELDLSKCINLRHLCLKGQKSISSIVFVELKHLTSLSLTCTGDDLDLSWCANIETLHIEGQVTMLPNTLLNMKRLKRLTLMCICDGLDLEGCHSLEKVHLRGQITLLPNNLRTLKRIKVLTLMCTCDSLDLLSCYNITTLHINGKILVLPKALTHLQILSTLTLRCKSDNLELPSGSNLRTMTISGQVTLVNNTQLNMKYLKHLTLRCKCDGLDLSLCRSLKTLYLSRHVTLKSNGLHDLQNLRCVTLRTKYAFLDILNCLNLEKVLIRGTVNLMHNTFSGLNNLKRLTLWCRSDRLDLSSCHNLEKIDLRKKVSLLPNALNGLQKLTRVKLLCRCDGLNLAGLDSLQELVMNGQVRLLPNTLHKLKKLNSLTLYGTSKATDIQKWFAFTNKDHSEINHSPLPLTITNITFIDVCFSTLSLRRLLRTISKLNHQATCYLNQCCITTSEQISEGLISSPDSLMIPCDMSNVSLTIQGENPDLYDALIGSHLVCINIIQINHPSSLSEALLTLTRLKTLRLISREYIDIPFRLICSEMKLVFIYKTLSVDSLRHLLRRISVLNYSVESQILFGYTEQLDGFMAINHELLATKQIDVKEFATMGRSSYCLNSMHETVEMDFFRNLHYVSDHMINVQLRYNCSQKLQPRCSVN